jgi:phage terminase Nu1 subunit (DNA packaging protein)
MRNRARATQESFAIALAEHDAQDRRVRNAESAHMTALEDGLNEKTTIARSVSDLIRSIPSFHEYAYTL